jgi:ABC-type Fe3+/spermidine/putrescine transport system ATPase subunit
VNVLFYGPLTEEEFDVTDPRPVIEIVRVSKRFDATQALSGVSLSLLPGEIHSLVGENGAGKSTLIKIMTGIHPADSGEMLLGGEHFAPRNSADAQRQGIAAIYQEPSVFPDLSVAPTFDAGDIVSSARPTWCGRSRKLPSWRRHTPECDRQERDRVDSRAGIGEVVDELRTITGEQPARIAVVGGGARVPLLHELLSERTGLGVVRGSQEATALGNAIVQGLAIGAFATIEEARDWLGAGQAVDGVGAGNVTGGLNVGHHRGGEAE